MRKKLKRFQANTQLDNIIEPGKPIFSTIKGKWNKNYFKNTNKIVLELGCGYGEYSISLAQMHTNKNLIGVDVKGSRLWVGGTQALKYQLYNVAFLRAQIQHIDQFFAQEEIDEIYIPFPDPRPRTRDIKKRLISPEFLKLYQNILKPQGLVHLKTDNLQLFEYTLEILQNYPGVYKLIYTCDLYQSDWQDVHYNIKTKYELKYLDQGVSIKYIRFALDKNLDT